ncbi:MAG: MipA/OmpV family protein [Sphingomonas sp.]|nr:MipA/OmpV family protein [Sphingomonas sp.]
MFHLLPAALAAGSIVAPAQAQEAPADRPPPVAGPADPNADSGRDTVTIGGGIGVVPSYEGSNNYVIIPAAAVRGRISGFNFASRGTVLSVDLLRDRSPSGLDIQFGPAINVNFNRVGRRVDARVKQLSTRKLALEAGGYFGIAKTGVLTSPYDTLGASVTVLADTTGIHNSYTITPMVTYGTPLSRKAYVGLSLSGTWAGDGYARSYFGVTAPESVRSGLPVFANAKGGFKNYTIGTLATYSLTGDLRHGLGIFFIGSYSRYYGDFARSPLVSVAGNPNQFVGAVGLGYTF